MNEKDNYLKLISERGDRYGGSGGLLDLLMWCNKKGIVDVTAKEARIFLENPDIPYSEAMEKTKG